MAKITISGCGKCKKSKGCEIKKQFREAANLMPHTYKIRESWCGLNSDYEDYYEVKLRCPIMTPKYNENDKVLFTLGVQRFTQEIKWDCDISRGDDDPCEFCTIENCDGGLVTFKNTRYKKYIECTGSIVGKMRADKWIIKVNESEWERISKLCNDIDIKFFEDVANSIDFGSEFFMVFVSKEKFFDKVE
jgi:hypothetical protein